VLGEEEKEEKEKEENAIVIGEVQVPTWPPAGTADVINNVNVSQRRSASERTSREAR